MCARAPAQADLISSGFGVPSRSEMRSSCNEEKKMIN